MYIDTYRDQKLFQWNVSVSDHCCLHCDDVVYKADTVIDTIQYEDDCKTTETTICRILPGYVYLNVFLINLKYKMIGYQKAVVEYEFNYRNCCNDEDGKLSFIFQNSYIIIQAYLFWKRKSLNQTLALKDFVITKMHCCLQLGYHLRLLNPETSSELYFTTIIPIFFSGFVWM